MDMATIGAKVLKKRGRFSTTWTNRMRSTPAPLKRRWRSTASPKPSLIQFKNETHNHPTEIEPFGGAATCLGGAIRDPLSGRAYVYQAMRVTGSARSRACPLKRPWRESCPRRKITTGAAAGYSSYGNQIGLATGQVHRAVRPGLCGQAAGNRRGGGRLPQGARACGSCPQAGRRDCAAWRAHRPGRLRRRNRLLQGARRQNPSKPAARRCKRAIRRPSASCSGCSADPEVSRLIKRCNDFGAGGVCVAIGELADGPGHRPRQGSQKIRGPGRHRAGYLGIAGTYGGCTVGRGCGRLSIAAAGEENLEATAGCGGHRRATGCACSGGARRLST